jgi:3-oxoacyl-[acyl-carrier-protein] synthase III
MAGALVLSRSAAQDRGFGPVWLRTSPESFDGQQGSCDLSVHGIDSRDKVDVVRAPDYIPRLVSFASEVVNAYLDEHQYQKETLLLVCSQPSATFGTELADAIGVPSSALVSTFEQYGDTHTSSLALGYQVATANGLLEGRQVLFVEAGAGLTVGCTVYT